MLAPLRSFSLQPKGFFRRTRGRIYVAFGEHPAAGVCVCVCSSKLLCVCVFVRLFVSLCPSLLFWLVGWLVGWLVVCGYMVFLLCLAPWGTFWCVFFASWVSFLCVFCILGTLGFQCGTRGKISSPLESMLLIFLLSGPLGLNFVTPVPFWHLGVPFWCLFHALGPDLGSLFHFS